MATLSLEKKGPLSQSQVAACFGGRLLPRSQTGSSQAVRGNLLEKIAASGRLEEWQSALGSSLLSQAKETLLECIGASRSPLASEFLKGMLRDPERGLQRAAIRGLEATGSPVDAAFLGALMFNKDFAIEETTEAALALGGSAAGNATRILVQAYAQAAADELAQCILIGLAQRPFIESEVFLRQVLSNPTESSSRKKDVLEALGQFDSVPDAFFLSYLESPDLEVRRGAYQGVGKLNETQLWYRLLLALQKEQQELARADLYEVLSVKDTGNPVLLNQIACSERDPLLRTMAAGAVARSLLGRNSQDPLIEDFNRQWVPELYETALHGSQADGIQAIKALVAAGQNESALSALIKVAGDAQNSKVKEVAQRALARSRRSP